MLRKLKISPLQWKRSNVVKIRMMSTAVEEETYNNITNSKAAIYLRDIKYADLTNIKIQEAKGRFEIVNDSPIKIIDGAHNYEGVEILLRNYENKYGHLNTDLFVGFKKGKDINNIFNLIIGKKNYNLHLIEDDTFFDQEITKEIGYLLDKHGKNYKISSLEQFNRNKNPSILLGSLYLIGEYKKRNI